MIFENVRKIHSQQILTSFYTRIYYCQLQTHKNQKRVTGVVSIAFIYRLQNRFNSRVVMKVKQVAKVHA